MRIESAILEILKQELECTHNESNYSQWILGVSIRKDRGKDRLIGSPTYIARVVLKTSDSPYVDGMDIVFMVPEDEVIIEENYYENSPDYHGGTVDDSLKWLKQLEEISYLRDILSLHFAKISIFPH